MLRKLQSTTLSDIKSLDSCDCCTRWACLQYTQYDVQRIQRHKSMEAQRLSRRTETRGILSKTVRARVRAHMVRFAKCVDACNARCELCAMRPCTARFQHCKSTFRKSKDVGNGLFNIFHDAPDCLRLGHRLHRFNILSSSTHGNWFLQLQVDDNNWPSE